MARSGDIERAFFESKTAFMASGFYNVVQDI
jgi:hypothetical protein